MSAEPVRKRRGRQPRNEVLIKRVAETLAEKSKEQAEPVEKPMAKAKLSRIRAQQIYNDHVVCLVDRSKEPCVMTFQTFAMLVLENGYSKKTGMFADIVVHDGVIRRA
jgi:hypothetical protein